MSELVLRFGNPAPRMHVDDGAGRKVAIPAPHLSQTVTTVEFWDGVIDPSAAEHTLSTDNDRMLMLIARSLSPKERRYAVAIYELEQIVDVHAGGNRPSWVACDDAGLQRAVAAYFQCAEGEPVMLLTNGGRDNHHARNYTTGAQPAAANYLALTANAAAPVATDTTLAGEIATAGGGLVRAQATYAHSAGTNTSTLTRTFTANGSDVLPVTIAKIGAFNASTAGTLEFETLLSSTATLSASGDSLTETETITAG